MTKPGDSSQRPPEDQPPPDFSPLEGSAPPPSYPPSYPPPPSYPEPPPPYQFGYPGAPFPGGYGAPQPHTNPIAIGSLVASIVGVPLFFVCYTGGIAAIAGMVLGIVGLNQIKQSGEQGRGFAIAGIVIGGVVLAFHLLFVILALASNSLSYL